MSFSCKILKDYMAFHFDLRCRYNFTLFMPQIYLIKKVFCSMMIKSFLGSHVQKFSSDKTKAYSPLNNTPKTTARL